MPTPHRTGSAHTQAQMRASVPTNQALDVMLTSQAGYLFERLLAPQQGTADSIRGAS